MENTAHLVECWLPDLQRFDPAHPLRAWLQRGSRVADGAKGYLGGLADYFQDDGNLPAAALTRELIAGDAAQASWLSADPAWVQPDMSGARLLACGRLPLDLDEAQALAESLQPIFAEAGMTLLVSSAQRWHLRLPAQTPLPDFPAPEHALGEDLYEHLPQGPGARRWRMLFNEVQVLLHQHPLNAERRARDLPPVNSLWFWGGGTLPSRVNTRLRGVIGEDLLLMALAHRAGIPAQRRSTAAIEAAEPGWLLDLQDLPAEDIATTWWPSLQALARRKPLLLAFASGERWLYHPWHRWRFWRRLSA